jgi:hypothetical protein
MVGGEAELMSMSKLRLSSSFQGLQVERGLAGAWPLTAVSDWARAFWSSFSGTTSGLHLAADDKMPP